MSTRLVNTNSVRTVCHFKNHAARVRALEDAGLTDKDIPSSVVLTQLVAGKVIAQKYVKPVHVKVFTHEGAPAMTRKEREKARRSRSRPPRKARTVSLGAPHQTIDEMAYFAVDMAAVNPRAFRQPGKRPGSTSLVEQLAVAAGQMEPPKLERSARGLKKLDANEELKEAIRLERINGIDPKYLSAHARRRLAQVSEMKRAA